MKRFVLLGGLLFAAGFLCRCFIPMQESWAVPQSCVPGDINGDQTTDISDAISLLSNLFLGTEGPAECPCDPETRGPVSTVIVVRHAERETTGDDPGLTPEGLERAGRLGQVLSETSIDRLIISERRRTRDTLAAVIDSTGLEPVIVSTREDDESSRPGDEVGAEVAQRIRELPAGSVSVVCHHSFTLKYILEALGFSSEDAASPEWSSRSDNLVVVQLPPGRPPQMLRLIYP